MLTILDSQFCDSKLLDTISPPLSEGDDSLRIGSQAMDYNQQMDISDAATMLDVKPNLPPYPGMGGLPGHGAIFPGYHHMQEMTSANMFLSQFAGHRGK